MRGMSIRAYRIQKELQDCEYPYGLVIDHKQSEQRVEKRSNFHERRILSQIFLM